MEIVRKGCIKMTAEFNTKYNFAFSQDVILTPITRLTNQLWKLIPMRENQEDWKKQLDTVIIEIAGLAEIFGEVPLFLQLLSKLEGLKSSDLEFSIYRKTVFETISLLQGLKKNV